MTQDCVGTDVLVISRNYAPPSHYDPNDKGRCVVVFAEDEAGKATSWYFFLPSACTAIRLHHGTVSACGCCYQIPRRYRHSRTQDWICIRDRHGGRSCILRCRVGPMGSQDRQNRDRNAGPNEIFSELRHSETLEERLQHRPNLIRQIHRAFRGWVDRVSFYL